MRSMTTLFLIIVAIYAAMTGYMYVNQRRLMYFPDKMIGSPAEYGLERFEDLRAKSEDGLSIQLWYRKAAAGFPTIIYYHGNAAHIGNRAGILGALAQKGFGVLGLSYRGYGLSEGAPDEQGLYHDGRAAIRFLTEKEHIPLNRIMIYGESLGTGVAVQIASEFDVAGLILQAPYTSVAGRAAEIYYYIPVRYLIKDRYDSIDKIARVKAPLLIFHGELDPTIPVSHGKRLLETATSAKRGFFLRDIAHNDFDSDEISAHVLDFAKEHHLLP